VIERVSVRIYSPAKTIVDLFRHANRQRGGAKTGFTKALRAMKEALRDGAALKMRVEDLQSKGTGWLIRLHEKGGKQHVMPCHHALAEALHAYIAAAGIAEDKKGFLFRTSRGHGGTALADQPMTQVDAWHMVRKRALAAGIMAPIGNHSFRATGITAYLANGGTLEHAQSMAAHESPRTTKLYDRTKERLTQDEIERIVM
jgi:integrase